MLFWLMSKRFIFQRACKGLFYVCILEQLILLWRFWQIYWPFVWTGNLPNGLKLCGVIVLRILLSV
jgi:hypothetical protein